MQILTALPSLLALLAGITAASSPPRHHTKVCHTLQKYTKAKTRPHTYCSSITTSCSDQTTVEQTTTITPLAATTTVSITDSTTVLAPATTGTATETSTSTSTTTSTTTTTSTNTVTSTATTASTSMVSANPTFVPAADTVLGSSYDRPSSAKKRNLRRRGTSQNPAAKGKLLISKQPSYPGDVQCYEYFGKCTTGTVTRWSTSTAPQPSTVTSTTTVTSTATSTPGVTTTTTVGAVTVTTTTETSSTSTETTTTVTSYSTTVTAYDACSTNNMVRYITNGVNTGAIDEATFRAMPPTGGVSQTKDTNQHNAYDCCVAALLNPLTSHFFWLYPTSACYIIRAGDGTCASGQAIDLTCANTSPGQFDLYYAVGNGNCGHWRRNR